MSSLLKTLTALITFFILPFSFSIASESGFDNPKPNINVLWYTEHFPPYNFIENGLPRGVAIDILNQAHSNEGLEFDYKSIKFQDWSRSYYDAVNTNDKVVLFSTARTSEREKHFKWIGPIAQSGVSVLTLQSSNLTLKHPQDWLLTRFVTVKGDVAEELLKQKYAESIQSTRTFEDALARLVSGKAVALVYEENTAYWLAKELGVKSSNFKKIYAIQSVDLYFAFNNNFTRDEFNFYKLLIDKVINDSSRLNSLEEMYRR